MHLSPVYTWVIKNDLGEVLISTRGSILKYQNFSMDCTEEKMLTKELRIMLCMPLI